MNYAQDGYLYFGDLRSGDRAATVEEVAAWESANQKYIIQQQITALEVQNLMPRAQREFMLLFMETNFQPEQLAANPGYQAVKAFDNEIVVLRAQL